MKKQFAPISLQKVARKGKEVTEPSSAGAVAKIASGRGKVQVLLDYLAGRKRWIVAEGLAMDAKPPGVWQPRTRRAWGRGRRQRGGASNGGLVWAFISIHQAVDDTAVKLLPVIAMLYPSRFRMFGSIRIPSPASGDVNGCRARKAAKLVSEAPRLARMNPRCLIRVGGA